MPHRSQVMLLTVSLVTACGHTLDENYRHAMVAHEIQCPREDAQVTERAPNLFEVRGCGREGAVKCSSRICANLTNLAKERFELEYGCTAAQSVVREISPLVFQVDGCEKSANFVCDMHDHLARCVAESAHE